MAPIEKPYFRDGKLILKLSVAPDGRVSLYKPGKVKPDHLMRMTGAPGWDKEIVDEVFTRGVQGSLRYQYGDVWFSINIDVFREHCFEKETEPFGMQYHCNVTHYLSTGIVVSPTREPEAVSPVIPERIVFGEVVPCTNCKGAKCVKCKGIGYLPWKSSS